MRFWVLVLGAILCCGLSAQNREWVDLPDAEFFPALCVSSSHNGRLREMVQSYHALDKNDEGLLSQRSQALLGIARLLEVAELRDKNLASKFQKLARNKSWYLEELEKIYASDLDTYEKLLTRHSGNIAKLAAVPGLQPLVLVNKIMFDPKLPGHWGLFWMETIDPCHRQLMPFFMRWTKLKAPKPHFFMWLETEDIPFYVPALRFLNDEELARKQIRIVEGKLLDYAGSVLQMNDSEREYIFIIDLEKKFFASEGNHAIHHVSLSRGNPLLASGALKVFEGKLIFMNMESGHYLPGNAAAKQALELLNELGVDVFTDASLEFYDEGKVSKTTFKAFLAETFCGPKGQDSYVCKKDFNLYCCLRGTK